MQAILRQSLIVLSAFLLIGGLQGAAAQLELDTDGNVGIGTSADDYDKLHVYGVGTDGVYAYSTDDSYSYALQGNSYGNSGGYGVYGYAYDASYYNYGVRGYASSASATTSTNYGVYGRAYNGDTAYGGYFSVGGSAATQYAGYFSGNVNITGTLSSSSDRKLKENVQALGEAGVSTDATGAAQDVLQKLLQLRPSTYEYTTDPTYEHMNLPQGTQYGLVAQEVEQIFPELVSDAVHPGKQELGENGEVVSEGEPTQYKSVNYVQLIPLLVQAIQEQQAEIEDLKEALGRR